MVPFGSCKERCAPNSLPKVIGLRRAHVANPRACHMDRKTCQSLTFALWMLVGFECSWQGTPFHPLPKPPLASTLTRHGDLCSKS